MEYKNLHKKYTENYTKLKSAYRNIGYIILLLITLILFCGYHFLKTNQLVFIIITIITIVVYLLILKYQDKIKWNKNVAKQQLYVNETEIDFVENQVNNFKVGITYLEPNHSYANDLDIFGKGSLFQYLNRTATFIGEKTLANNLTTLLNNEAIMQHQEAVKELKDKVTFRQKFNAIATLINDTSVTYNKLITWTTVHQANLPLIINVLSFVMPVLTWSIFILFYIKGTTFWFNVSTAIFIANNIILSSQLKKIKKELIDADHIDNILKGYSVLLKEIEQQNFKSSLLINIQEEIKCNAILASNKIKELSSIFNSLNSIQNVFGAAIINGLFLSHLHILKRLLQWKTKHANLLQTWLDTIGKIEALNCFANFNYNNPTNCFPNLNTNAIIEFKELGHPLINEKKRINNDVSFTPQNFVILSGSNMSGKSTFLRSVGINMVLTGCGSCVCATSATIHPLQVYASMRLVDSLNENESYFFAEIKRLQYIKNALDSKKSFVLLDEILRGTNSDDKQNGTIQFIKKMVERNAIGIIATHDLEVCETTNQYPTQLINKCFEVEIINNDLHFDYKLRNGICKNKSATFLMEKLGVI